MDTLRITNMPEFTNFRRGKVRDIYKFENELLIISTDRISAFDVVMEEPVPGKGKLLSSLSAFWFDKTKNIIPNHFITNNIDEYPLELHKYRDQLEGRSMLVRKCKPLPVEFIVRGYLAGSAWKEYQKSQSICQIPLPEGLIEFSKLPEPIFTPSTKAELGHDENINFEKTAELIGEDLAIYLRDKSIELYKFGAHYLEQKGIILADTKFEFGKTDNGEIILIDEALTPDSSRLWLKGHYEPGKPQIQFDKQILRDYLETLEWDKQPPPPKIPKEIINQIAEVYRDIYTRIVG